MKKGDHKGLGGNSRRTERKRNRYATNLDKRDSAISKRIAALDDAAKAAKNIHDLPAIQAKRAALVVKLRRVERLSLRSRKQVKSIFAAPAA
jgi:hypothetical protein